MADQETNQELDAHPLPFLDYTSIMEAVTEKTTAQIIIR